MRKSIAVSLLAAFAVALSATQLRAQYSNLQTTLASLPAGTQYQIVFVTDDTTTATDSNIGDYNSFVQADVPAALTSFLAGYGGPPASWNAIGSTASVNANSNAPSTGLVFNTDGQEVASPTASLYSGSLLSPIMYGPSAISEAGEGVWTGSTTAGLVVTARGLGASGGFTEIGDSSESGGGWVANAFASTDTALPMYALSTEITAVPEPATFTLFGSALLLLGGFRCQQRRRRAIVIRADR
jgi:hypothetical protein